MTDIIAEMRSLRYLNFLCNITHTFTDVIEMCNDKEFGFEFNPGKIAKFSLAQIMYLRKTFPGVIFHFKANRIYHYDPNFSPAL